MGWMEIGTALLLGAVLVFLVPRLPAILRATPKASGKQWLTALVPACAHRRVCLPADEARVKG